jgi:hypothetical protein
MVNRSEEDKMLRAPIMVVLGGKEYEVRPLVIAEAREWRKKLAKLFSQVPKYTNATSEDEEAFSSAINSMIIGMPEEMNELFFSYAKDLDRDQIEREATEVELADAIVRVMDVALPLVRGMTRMMQRLA